MSAKTATLGLDEDDTEFRKCQLRFVVYPTTRTSKTLTLPATLTARAYKESETIRDYLNCYREEEYQHQQRGEDTLTPGTGKDPVKTVSVHLRMFKSLQLVEAFVTFLEIHQKWLASLPDQLGENEHNIEKHVQENSKPKFFEKVTPFDATNGLTLLDLLKEHYSEYFEFLMQWLDRQSDAKPRIHHLTKLAHLSSFFRCYTLTELIAIFAIDELQQTPLNESFKHRECLNGASRMILTQEEICPEAKHYFEDYINAKYK